MGSVRFRVGPVAGMGLEYLCLINVNEIRSLFINKGSTRTSHIDQHG